MKLSRCFSLRTSPSIHRINSLIHNNPLLKNRTVSIHHFNVRNHSVWTQKRVINPILNRQSSLPQKWNIKIPNHLYLGIYRSSYRFGDGNEDGDPKKAKKKKKSPLSTPKASDPPEGDRDAKPDLQHVPGASSGELSTFVVIKEKTQETFSVIYIVGILFCCLPYTIYLVFKSLFSSSGSDKIRNETFDLIREDSRILRILGNDVIAKQVAQNVSFIDNQGQERMQIIYEIQGRKGEGKVHVEMLKEDKEWRMQYCIVATQFSEITIVDNRLLFA